MSIKILHQDEIKQAASSFQQPELLFANPKNLYSRRAKRLRELAQDNPFSEYLEFAANLVDIQLELLGSHPIANYSEKLTAYVESTQGDKPLNSKNFQRSDEWRILLLAIIDKFKPYANDTVLSTIEWLEKASMSELETLADYLLNERYEQVSADKAVFIWSALSLYWVQLTQQLPRTTRAEIGHKHFCPVCNSAPVTSVIHFGEVQGLRYLHCSLCESEWHVVRSKCTNCDESGKLDYWSLDKIEAAVKAESCGDCHSYLKVLYQDKDINVEPVADDLASLFLDSEMEQKNFTRSGLNPFLFKTE
ncbi:formate dehydrogenase accessory protein FdhE [Mannheimia varigena]|uniref:formate dehydrogenase accessory protein FdhE n=1 Tax=Mannheimia varigena TaxID=85404 RepID=UPI0015B5F7A8|nr:formate dehydrogenase accessory protein FdhE [Mannheimia varigena]MDY2948076.1 formate dehydrogenase accessory protein FdhE [Mannheimia varigena]QLD33431.1 formate dehydrogenase accessory protein FdhE [Mannheimia varigena]